MDDVSRYEAVRSRDERFDGAFFTAVLTTGIYCRPSCPARTPHRANVRFYPSSAAAQRAGFRACKRCRPDAVPGSADWNQRADVVGRAMRLIADGVMDREGVTGLADRLGYSTRQVQRQLSAEVGAGPAALARAQRAHTARVLLQTTTLPVTGVAFAAGFASVRQFNDTMREIYASTPSQLRGASRALTAGEGVALRLACREPYAASALFDFLARRAIDGLEDVTGTRGARTYRRALTLPYGHGVAEVGESGGAGWLPCQLHLADLRDLPSAVQRLRRLLDLDADPHAVAERLGADPVLGSLVAATPGLRSPGAADGVELAARAVLGQQVTVSAARTLAGRLVTAYGKPLPKTSGTLTRLFPTADTLADAPLEELGMPHSRRRALRTVMAALADGKVTLDPGADWEETQAALLSLPGIGPWTAGYLRMRALGDPDVFLPSDVGARAGLRRVGATPASVEAWRPWRSYALHHLWNSAYQQAG